MDKLTCEEKNILGSHREVLAMIASMPHEKRIIEILNLKPDQWRHIRYMVLYNCPSVKHGHHVCRWCPKLRPYLEAKTNSKCLNCFNNDLGFNEPGKCNQCAPDKKTITANAEDIAHFIKLWFSRDCTMAALVANDALRNDLLVVLRKHDESNK